MPESYTLEQAELDIAQLRGQVGVLSEILALQNGPVPNAPASGEVDLFAALGQPNYINAAGLQAALSGGKTDTTTHTVTQAAFTDLSSVFTIPANDANLGTLYRVTCWGDGTWGSTAQALSLEVFAEASGRGSSTCAAGAFSTNANFRFWAIVSMLVTGTGASGSAQGNMTAFLAETANNVNPGTASTNAFPLVGGAPGGFTLDTTSSTTLSLRAQWAATTGAPTLTCRGSAFERVGP